MNKYLCLVCKKKAEVMYDGFTFCLKHYEKMRKYPDPRDVISYIKYETEKRQKA